MQRRVSGAFMARLAGETGVECAVSDVPPAAGDGYLIDARLENHRRAAGGRSEAGSGCRDNALQHPA